MCEGCSLKSTGKDKECEKWLAEFLRHEGTTLCDMVREAARKNGFSRAALKAARKALGVKTFNQFDEYGGTHNWFWYLEE